MQAGLQVFAWAESQEEGRRHQRERYTGGSKSLSQEPMFCFERALKLLYFSALAYDIEEVSDLFHFSPDLFHHINFTAVSDVKLCSSRPVNMGRIG